MNRQQEYWDLIRQLDQTPEALDGTALRAKARAKRRRMGKRWGISLGGAAGVCAAFILAVNTLPTFALVVTMNAINTALRQRGQAIRDWDQRDKVIQKFSVLGGKVYALAPSNRPSEVSTNGDGDEKPGG